MHLFVVVTNITITTSRVAIIATISQASRSDVRTVPEIILWGGGPQTLFCPVGGRVFC